VTDQDVCTFCEKPGRLIQVRGMKGTYHLKCVAEAKKAWEAARAPSILDLVFRK